LKDKALEALENGKWEDCLLLLCVGWREERGKRRGKGRKWSEVR
jgi:hypothetical protein